MICHALAFAGLIFGSILGLSLTQGCRVHAQICKTAEATHGAMGKGFCRCIVASAGVLPLMVKCIQTCAKSALDSIGTCCGHRGEAGDEFEDVESNGGIDPMRGHSMCVIDALRRVIDALR